MSAALEAHLSPSKTVYNGMYCHFHCDSTAVVDRVSCVGAGATGSNVTQTYDQLISALESLKASEAELDKVDSMLHNILQHRQQMAELSNLTRYQKLYTSNTLCLQSMTVRHRQQMAELNRLARPGT